MALARIREDREQGLVPRLLAHPGKMSVRSKFLHASWSCDFLLDMVRTTRRRM